MHLFVGGDRLVYIRIDPVTAALYVCGSLVVGFRVASVSAPPASLASATA
ncbi:hypothetical protein NNO_2128 [Hydrogenimonas sp.]|nr:hypothetical protein NNO_2128 [Hydrogenimonas sp.]